MNRSEAIAAHIAKRIVRNTRKKWASLHADALQELYMSNTTDNMNVKSQVPNPEAKRVDQKDLISGKDTRAVGAQPAAVPQPAPRGETEQAGS
jgi:hypothetical protein